MKQITIFDIIPETTRNIPCGYIDDISLIGRELRFDELEMSPSTYQNAEKLATFYSLYDHLYVRKQPMNLVETTREVTIDRYGDTEFYKVIEGKKAEDVWPIIDELMSTIKALQRKLYDATIDRLKDS